MALKDRDGRYPEESAPPGCARSATRGLQPRSSQQGLRHRAAALGEPTGGEGTSSPVGTAQPAPGEEGTHLGRQCRWPPDLSAATRAERDAAMIPGVWGAVSRAPILLGCGR